MFSGKSEVKKTDLRRCGSHLLGGNGLLSVGRSSKNVFRHICMVQGKEVGKHLWKLSVKCDVFLPSFFWLVLLAEFGFAFLFYFFELKELPGNYCRSFSEFLCKTLEFLLV